MEIKVTRIKNRFHARLYVNGKVFDEMACTEKKDIGFICREMLRWYDKGLGPHSDFASAARSRQTPRPPGKIWYRLALRKIDRCNGCVQE